MDALEDASCAQGWNRDTPLPERATRSGIFNYAAAPPAAGSKGEPGG
jgi:hypothetical protein